MHDESCEGDFGSEGQESPCRCEARAKEKRELDNLREMLREFSPESLKAETVVNHRIGFWNITDPYDPEITEAHIALADEELERYVQMRIAQDKENSDGP